MPIPAHSPSCQTWIYPTNCWSCDDEIFVLQCTCGSVVLLDERVPPWPKHYCTKTGSGHGIGGSGLSGWMAIDTLEAQGIRITFDIMEKIFPSKKQGNHAVFQETEIRKIEPEGSSQLSLLAVVREMPQSTRRTKEIADLPEMGLKLLGIEPGITYRQITLVDNQIRPNESYTAFIPKRLAAGLIRNGMVVASMRGCVVGNFVGWIVTDISLL